MFFLFFVADSLSISAGAIAGVLAALTIFGVFGKIISDVATMRATIKHQGEKIEVLEKKSEAHHTTMHELTTTFMGKLNEMSGVLIEIKTTLKMQPTQVTAPYPVVKQ